MSILYSDFRADLLHISGPPSGRPLNRDETATAVGIGNLAEVLTVYEASFGQNARTSSVLSARLQRGARGYLLRKRRQPASVIWVTRDHYDIYPLRLRVHLDATVAAVYDEATVPTFRRQGMLGALLRFAWQRESWTAAGCCIRAQNSASLDANSRIGFRQTHTVACQHLGGVLRRHEVTANSSCGTSVLWSVATAWENSRRLSSVLTPEGYEQFRITDDGRSQPGPSGVGNVSAAGPLPRERKRETTLVRSKD